MSEQGADRAGNKLANAAIIAATGFAIGFVLIGITYLLSLIRASAYFVQ